MYDLEYFDTYLNQLDLESFNSINLEIDNSNDNYNNSFKNTLYLTKEQELTTIDSKKLTTIDSKELTTIDSKELTTIGSKELTTIGSKELTTIGSKELITASKKRIRQNKINSASRRCKKKQKIKSIMMESYITQVHENIKKLYTFVDNLNMQEVITMVYKINCDMDDYSKNIIKEINKI
jgi:hypothetical protein